MTNEKPASDGGMDPAVFAELLASVESAKKFSASVSHKPERMTVEERYRAERGIKAQPIPKRPSIWHRFRSAVTGLWVSKKYAEANPETTIREKAD